MIFNKYWFLFVVFVFPDFNPSSGIFAQACCSTGTPIAGSLALRTLQKGTTVFDVQYDYNSQHDLVTGGDKLDDNPRKRITHSWILRGTYSFSPRWSASLMASFIRQEERTKSIIGSESLKFANGIGDAQAYVQYIALTHDKLDWILGVGGEIPIGTTDKTDPVSKLPFHPDMQPGRAATAINFSSQLNYKGVLRPTGVVGLTLGTRQTFTSDRYENQQRFKFGNEYRAELSFGDQFIIANQIIGPFVSIFTRHTSRDQIDGIETTNSGGTWLHLRGGLNWKITPSLELFGFAEIPAFRDLNETQLSTSFRTRWTLSYYLSPKNKD